MRSLPSTLAVALLAVGGRGAVAPAQATRPAIADAPAAALDLDPGRLVADQIAALARQMVELTIDQDARDAAAGRLLAIGTAEARSAVQFALRDPGNNPGRLAAARAVADDLPPDTAFVDALFVLIDADVPRPIVDAAVVALGNFKAEPEVSTRLVALTAGNRPEAVRLAAIRALASQVEKSAARRLVELAVDPSPAVAAAAAEAVRAFACFPIAAPADWWRTQQDRPDDRFRFDVLSARAARSEHQNRNGEETFQELRRRLSAELNGTPREQRGATLAGYLGSPRDAVRLIAARQAYDYATTGDLTADALVALRGLLGDPSAELRYDAARTMGVAPDAEAFGAIARQLAVEPDPRVRAELAGATGAIGNVEAVPLLRALLDDASPAVALASANALARLGPLVAGRHPRDAADLAFRLQAALADGGGAVAPRADPRLRESLLRALAALGQRSSRQTFSDLLVVTDVRPPEPDAIRRLAVLGLGAIGEPATIDQLLDATRDPAAEVRREAVAAIGRVSRDFYAADALYRSMDPAREPDAGVREAAWQVLTGLFDVAPRQQLARWPDQPLIRADPQRRVVVYGVLARKAEDARDPDDRSACLQRVGDAQMEQGAAAEAGGDGPLARARYADATASFQQALSITRDTGGSAARTQTLVESTLRSQLRGRDYAGAARFASELFVGRDGASYLGSLAPEFKLEAERLATMPEQFDDAMSLIREALAMTPALPPQQRSQLLDVQRTIERRRVEKNEFAPLDHGWSEGTPVLAAR